MAKVRFTKAIREVHYRELDLNRDDFTYLDWTDVNDISDINDRKLIPDEGGIFYIKWNPNSPNTFLERQGTLNVSYGYEGHTSDVLVVTSYPNEILYVGKSQNIRKLVMSITRPSSPIGREILELIHSTHPQFSQNNTVRARAAALRAEISCGYKAIPHPIERELLKTYAVSRHHPCLNIGLEH